MHAAEFVVMLLIEVLIEPTRKPKGNTRTPGIPNYRTGIVLNLIVRPLVGRKLFFSVGHKLLVKAGLALASWPRVDRDKQTKET